MGKRATGGVLLIIFASLAATAASSAPLRPADKATIAKVVKNQLKDADSAKFRWPAPRAFGLYCGWVNAKNSYGGYTGFEPFMVTGGIGDGPKSKGEFLAFDATIGSDDDLAIVLKMCAEQGFDMSKPPPSD